MNLFQLIINEFAVMYPYIHYEFIVFICLLVILFESRAIWILNDTIIHITQSCENEIVQKYELQEKCDALEKVQIVLKEMCVAHETNHYNNRCEIDTLESIHLVDMLKLDTIKESFNMLSLIKNNLEDSFIALEKEKNELEENFEMLESLQKELEGKYNNLDDEKDELEYKYSDLNDENDQLKKRVYNLEEIINLDPLPERILSCNIKYSTLNYGIIKYTNGNVYEGTFTNNYERCGYGRFYYTEDIKGQPEYGNVYLYRGLWFEDKRHGDGISLKYNTLKNNINFYTNLIECEHNNVIKSWPSQISTKTLEKWDNGELVTCVNLGIKRQFVEQGVTCVSNYKNNKIDTMELYTHRAWHHHTNTYDYDSIILANISQFDGSSRTLIAGEPYGPYNYAGVLGHKSYYDLVFQYKLI